MSEPVHETDLFLISKDGKKLSDMGRIRTFGAHGYTGSVEHSGTFK